MTREEFIQHVRRIVDGNLYIDEGRLGNNPKIVGYESLEMEAGDLYTICLSPIISEI